MKTCRFRAYVAGKHDYGAEQGDPSYLDRIALCGATEWLNGLCHDHGLIVLLTEEAKAVGRARVAKDGASGDAYSFAVVKGAVDARKAGEVEFFGEFAPSVRP